MTRRALLVVAAATIAAATVASVAIVALANFAGPASSGDTYRGSEPPAGIKLEAFALRSYRGNKVDSDQLAGKVVALTFLESKCTSSCPVIAFDVARGIERLSRKEREDVRAIAISTHPGDDTAANVREFLQERRATGTLDYLIGTEAELRPVWRRFDVLAALDSGNANTHSASVHIYNREGVWVSSLHPGVDLSPENLAHDLRMARKPS